MNPANELSPVQRTAFIPLACRALAHILHEFPDFFAPEAVTVCDALKVDLDRYGGSRISRKGLVMRSAWFERQIASSISDETSSDSRWQVVNIAAGFDTTAFKFLASEHIASWTDVDAIAVNRVKQGIKTFADANSPKYQIVDCDLNRTEQITHWLSITSRAKPKILIVMQGISMYLSEDLMQRLLTAIHNATQSSREVRILIDWCSPILNRLSFAHPAFLRSRIYNVRMDWSLGKLSDITNYLPGFGHLTTEDPIYSQTTASTRACKLLYERILRPSSPGIYGCSVFRRRSVE